MAAQQKFNDAFPINKAPAEFIDQLRASYGTAANIVPAKVPADPKAETSQGNELRTNYKGYIVAVHPDFIAQRVDTGGTRSNIVIHERSALSVPPHRTTGELPPIAQKFEKGQVNSFDVAISYGADGKGNLYARDRKMDEIQFAANTLKKHAGLEGAKDATFKKNIEQAVGNFREDHYARLKEQSQAYERRQERQSHAHNLVGGGHEASR